MEINPHPTNPSIFSIKSNSTPNEMHIIDYERLTCTCQYFRKFCERVPPNNPLRLCKHLIQVLIRNGIPPFLESCRKEIEQAGKKESRFIGETNKWKRELNKKITQTIFTVYDPFLKVSELTVDIASRICTCNFFERKLSQIPPNDPKRLCRHLIKVLVKIGIPEDLVPYKKNLEFSAKHEMEYTDAEEGWPRPTPRMKIINWKS